MSEIRVKSTGTIKLFESDNTSHVTIASPASLSANRTITIPDADVTLGAGVSLTGSTNNQVTTVTGANAITGETNFIYNGTIVGAGADGANADLGTGVHIKSGDSGQGSVEAEANLLILESASGGGLSIYTGNSHEAKINFGDSGNDNQGQIMYHHNGDSMRFNTNNDERMRIHSNGVISCLNGIALGVGTANTASNVLDDYEEGEFANALSIDSTTQTAYSSGRSHIKYVKIGSFVHCAGLIDTDGQTLADTGQIYVRLPFAVASSGSNSFNASKIFGDVFNASSSHPGYFYVQENDTICEFDTIDTSGSTAVDGSGLSVSNTSHRVFMFLNITYQTDA